jgi:hypothetical protein
MIDDKPGSMSRPVETTEGGMDEYLVRQLAEAEEAEV